MSATLADGGVNPVTGRRVVTPAVCQHALAVMATAGMYETSGDWLFDVGVPREERDRRRDRGRVARQGRPGHVLPPPRPGGEQRPGTARGAAPIQDARTEPVRVQGTAPSPEQSVDVVRADSVLLVVVADQRDVIEHV